MKRKLCGGIVFSLICEAKLAYRPSRHFEQVKELATENQLFSAFINMFTESKYDLTPITNQPISLYKNCSRDTVFNFNLLDDAFVLQVKKAIDSNFKDTINACGEILRKHMKANYFIETLCRRIITIILDDDAISENESFYFLENGQTITKKQLRSSKDLYFECVIVGTLYYIFVNKIKNSDCLDAFNEWFMQRGSNNLHYLDQDKFVCVNDVPTTLLSLGPVEEEGPEKKLKPVISKTKPELNKYGDYINHAVAYHSSLTTILDPYHFVDLYSFYINTDIARYDPKAKKAEVVLSGKEATPKNITDKFGKRICLVANGGFGKSVFLRHMFLCEKRYGDDLEDGVTGLIPVFLNINDFGSIDLSIEEFAFRMISKFTAGLNYNDFLEDLKKGIFLFLFDALDELGGSAVYRFIHDLNDFVDNYGDNHIILSSRLSNDAWPMLKDFEVIQLLPLDKYKIRRLVNKFTKFDEEVRESFLKKIDDKNNLSIIERNPLLLTIKFMVYASKKEFLDSETYRFYQRAYEVLYEEHDQYDSHYDHRHYKTDLSKRKLAQLIAEFSFYTFINHIYAFDLKTIKDTFDTFDLENKYDVDIQDFIYDCHKNLCLFYKDESKYRFVHRTFQEYFAALFMSQQKEEFFKDKEIFESLDRFSFIGYKNPLRPEQANQIKGLDTMKHYIDFTKPFNVFDMFRQMKPEKFAKCIILPKLDSVLRDPNDPYWIMDYVEKAYEIIHYVDGDTADDGNFTSFDSEILEYIYTEVLDHYYDHHELLVLHGKELEDFLETAYYITGYDPETNCPDYLRINVKTEELDTSELEPDEIPEPCGKYYLIPMPILLESGKYGKLINQLEEEFLDEYYDMVKFYKLEVKKYRK